MSNSPRLGIPYLVESQAQKEVTHNEAINMIELLVHPISESVLSTPPANPIEGALYLIGLGATGEWEGKDNYITEYISGSWKYCPPVDGMRIWDKNTGQALFYKAGSWQEETVSADVMLKSVYDTNNDGKVDAAETADKAPVNTFPIGDGTDATILIQAYNADTNKPGIRYSAVDNKWQYCNDGSTWADIGSGGGSSGPTFKTISVSGQGDVVAEVSDDALTLVAGSNIEITTDPTTDTVTISSTATPTDSFKTIAVAGQSNVVADSSTDTLTLAAGNNVTITTDPGTDTVTISTTGTGGSSNSFSTIAIDGQSNLVAESSNDTLTLIAGDNVTIIADQETDSITISASGGTSGSINIWQLLL